VGFARPIPRHQNPAIAAAPRTLVVVSHYDARPRRDLDALLGELATVPAGAPFETLVVVNQTQAKPTVVDAALPGLRVLHRENRGFNIGAWDHGLRSCPGYERYLFLQDECRLTRPGWLLPFLLRLARPEVGLVGERLNPAWQAPWSELERRFAGHTLADHRVDGAPAERLPTYRAFWRRHGIDPGERGDHLQTLVLAARGDVLARIGGFPSGADYGEAIAAEIGISKRVQMLGLSVEEVGPRPFTWITHPQWQAKAARQPLRAPRLLLAGWLDEQRAARRRAGERALPTIALGTELLASPAALAFVDDTAALIACREVLLTHCQWLLMPRVPRDRGSPGTQPLEHWFAAIPELYELETRRQLVVLENHCGPSAADAARTVLAALDAPPGGAVRRLAARIRSAFGVPGRSAPRHDA
jgi:hypothetical protein